MAGPSFCGFQIFRRAPPRLVVRQQALPLTCRSTQSTMAKALGKAEQAPLDKLRRTGL